MAADKPAKAPPLYEAGGPKSTAGEGGLDKLTASGMVAPMKRFAVIGTILLIAACNNAPTSTPAGSGRDHESGTRTPAPVVVKEAVPFEVDEKTDLIDFHYGWSKEAAAIDPLVAILRKRMERGRAELIADATKDKAFRDTQKLDFNLFSLSTDYSTAGMGERLLSLAIDIGSFTGGAHGNSAVGSLLWDRATQKEIDVADLFASAANRDILLTQSWCDRLNAVRAEKRGELVTGNGAFDDCPSLDDIAIIPADTDANGKFDTWKLVASPYVAGPYVEGEYEVSLPITPAVLAALKEQLRGDFEASQRAQ